MHFPPPGEHIRDFQEYGFLIGTFPTAPGVFVFAKLYNIDVDMVSVPSAAPDVTRGESEIVVVCTPRNVKEWTSLAGGIDGV